MENNPLQQVKPFEAIMPTGEKTPEQVEHEKGDIEKIERDRQDTHLKHKLDDQTQIELIKHELGINPSEKTAGGKEGVLTVEKINSLSTKELREQFSTDELLNVLNLFPYGFGDQEIPKDVLDAEAQVYSAYKPSEALQNKHKDANISAIKSYDPKELFFLRENWKTKIDIDQKIDFIKKYIGKLAKEYGFSQEIPIVVYDDPTDGEDAMWLPTHEREKIGLLILYKSVLERLDLPSMLGDISHEIAHAFQESLEKEIGDPQKDLIDDQKWFKMFSTRHGQRTKYTDAYKSSNLRYRAIPKEQDAWGMQLTAPNELNKTLEEYADKLLADEGLGSYSDIKNQSTVSKWVTRNLKETTTPEDLIKEAEKMVHFPDVSSRIINFISGKDREAIIDAIKNAEDDRKKAESLLGIST
jgi:hypothetical protein